ncbi:MAG: DUF3987 domain-containing protein [Acidimicrobiia bacterium]|nr:DUF3987 domain-containing protein [Acidimicrobiia bacterium]
MTPRNAVYRGFGLALDERALHGLAGDAVRMFRPHTEAADVAILIDLLASFGNAVGPGPYMVADGARHGTRINAVFVGPTSRARKGTARANGNWLMRHADPAWSSECVVSGIASGEGLIAALAEHRDGSAPDKRLFVVEPEFGRVLKVANRDGSIVSAVLRQAWDSGDLRNLTRHEPLRVDGSHVSMEGHITAQELRRYLTDVEVVNGFGNRFLWVWVERSKLLPHGGSLGDDEVSSIGRRIGETLSIGRKVGRMRRSSSADDLWETMYVGIDDEVDGMLGALLARAEAHLLRLSMIYALLDRSTVIEPEHLWAAAAVWDYSATSAARIFGSSHGDVVADRILDALRGASPKALTRTDLHRYLGNHVRAQRLEAAITDLTQRGAVEVLRQQSGGRPSDSLRLTPSEDANDAKEVPGFLHPEGLIALLSLRSQTGREPPSATPGQWNGDKCRCGATLERYDPHGFPFCESCGPPIPIINGSL